MLTNILWKKYKAPILGTKLYHIIEHEGRKIGFIGLAELEWVETLGEVEWETIDYEDFVVCAKRYYKFLKEEEKCDLVIALTHMRVPNDELLTRSVPELDLILGGHDHDYAYYC